MTDQQRPRASDFELRDLARNPDMRLAHEFYKNILLPSFPKDELEPWEVLDEAINNSPEFRPSIVIALEESGDVAGGIVTEWYPRSRVALVAYLATRPDLRGSGLGYRLTKVVSAWVRERDPALAVGEVEPPNRPPTGDATAKDYGDPVARLRLFNKLQGRVLCMPYLQPRLAPNLRRVPLLLIAFYLNPTVCHTEADELWISAAVLEEFLDEYFAACEGEDEIFAKDPEYLQLQKFLRESPSIAAIPVEKYLEITNSAHRNGRV